MHSSCSGSDCNLHPHMIAYDAESLPSQNITHGIRRSKSAYSKMAGDYQHRSSRLAEKGAIGEYGITILKLQKKSTGSVVTCFRTNADENSLQTCHVPFKNVLYCENLPDGEIELTYAIEKDNEVSIHTDILEIGAYNGDTYPDLAQHILSLSYKHNKPSPRILVILNHHGGQGNARKLYKAQILPVLLAARVEFTYLETEYSTHATDIARDMKIEDFDIIACCSGDGVPHEVINGFYLRKDRERAFEQVAITQLPCGSGNALSLSSHGTNNPGLAAVKMLKLRRTRMDVMAVSQGSSTKLSFLSQAYGTIADSDIGTEHLRWMGSVRFEVGVAQRLLAKTKYPCDLYVKFAIRDNSQIQRHYETHGVRGGEVNLNNIKNLNPSFPGLDDSPPTDWEKLPLDILQNLNIFYVGKMPYMLSDAQFFPAALPDDGCMDLVITTTNTSFFKMAKLLFSIDKGTHVHSPEVLHAKITAYRLVPRISAKNHFISVDGENFPFEPIQVEVLGKVMTGLLEDGVYVDTCFTKSE